MKMILVFLGCLVLLGLAAAVCPAGAADCFNCGAGPNGIACSKNCTGKWSESVHDYVSCECPQGKACACYCPYMPKLDDKCLLDPACVGEQLPAVNGVMGYAAKINGKAKLVKAGTGATFDLTELTVINPGDTIVIDEREDSVTMVFPGKDGTNIRTYHGMGDITFNIDKTDEQIERSMQEMNGHLWFYYLGKRIINQIEQNKAAQTTPGMQASTICGGGFSNPDFTDKMDEIRYMRSINCVKYDMQSEVLFEVDNGSQIVKVIEGKVTATDMDGNTAVVRTGEQLAIKNGNVSAATKSAFDFTKEPQWWTLGYSSSCDSTCATGETQSPFPGCSCIPKSSSGCSSAFILAFVGIAALLPYAVSRKT
ncbi:MAG: hypothetical protein V1492_04920 [Candidatus Micrarchaeota archaeon]